MRDINLAIQEHLNKVLEYYDKSNIIGIFLYGSQNYNTNLENSDVDTYAIIVPTFEDLCFNKVTSKEIKLENGEHCNIKDFREYIKMLKKQNINFVETLFTDYFWLNPLYEQIWKTFFIDKREKIARYDENKAIKSIMGQVIHTLKQNPKDSKKVSNAYRLLYFLELYISNQSYNNCIKLSKEKTDFLKFLKAQKEVSEYHAEKIIFKLKELESNIIILENKENKKILDDNFEKVIFEIIGNILINK